MTERIERNSPCRAVCRKAERDGHIIGNLRSKCGKLKTCRFSSGSPRKKHSLLWVLFCSLIQRRESNGNSPCRAVCRRQSETDIKQDYLRSKCGKLKTCRFSSGSPRRRKLHIARFFGRLKKLTHCAAPPPRKKSRSVFLFGCKRPHNEKLSLPTFYGL